MTAAKQRPGLLTRLFSRGAAGAPAGASAPAAEAARATAATLPLTAADEQRVEAEVRRMIAELRARPTQEKEDRIGLEIATMPAAERDLVPTILLRIVAEESGRGGRAVIPELTQRCEFSPPRADNSHH